MSDRLRCDCGAVTVLAGKISRNAGSGRLSRAMGDAVGGVQHADAHAGPGSGGVQPGAPASVTKDAAVLMGAPGVLMAETVLKSRRAAWRSS